MHERLKQPLCACLLSLQGSVYVSLPVFRKYDFGNLLGRCRNWLGANACTELQRRWHLRPFPAQVMFTTGPCHA